MTTLAPQPKRAVPSRRFDDEPEKLWGLMAEFETPAAIMHAAERVREAGYKWWDCHTPFPVHGLDKAMGIQPTVLPVLVFFGGLTGCIPGTILQWFTNGTGFDMWLIVWVRGYEFLISGKPFSSVPTWIPVVFEMTILLSAMAAVGWMLLLNGLPQLFHPTLKSRRFARATDDRFFLVIEARDPKFFRDRTEALLDSLDPISIEALEP
jgi:hypothetical protein